MRHAACIDAKQAAIVAALRAQGTILKAALFDDNAAFSLCL